jgi:hypothetical protein
MMNLSKDTHDGNYDNRCGDEREVQNVREDFVEDDYDENEKERNDCVFVAMLVTVEAHPRLKNSSPFLSRKAG